MKSESGHPMTALAQSEFGSIERCRCNGYHVRLRNITLHFNREEFAALADLFRRAQAQEEARRFSKWEEYARGGQWPPPIE